MSKLKLDPEDFEVQSFETTAGMEEERGTVHGHVDTYDCGTYPTDPAPPDTHYVLLGCSYDPVACPDLGPVW